MTRERIEDFRKIVLPFVNKKLLEINYENHGKSDVEEFTRDFNEILDLAIQALDQEPRKDYISIDDVMSVFDDYMRGEVDAQDTETFLEMLKDKAESEG